MIGGWGGGVFNWSWLSTELSGWEHNYTQYTPQFLPPPPPPRYLDHDNIWRPVPNSQPHSVLSQSNSGHILH